MHMFNLAIVPHATQNEFRRECLRLIIKWGLMAQYSRLNSNELKVINGKRKNGRRSEQKKRKLRPIFHQGGHAKIISV